LRRHAIFGALGEEATARLTQVSPLRLFAPSEHVITQGDRGASMFLLVAGDVEVRIARNAQSTVVARLHGGDCIGEMSLLTGDPRNATVVALTEVEAMEIEKEAFGDHVREHPEVLAQLSELLARRQLANEQQLAQGEVAARVEQTRVTLLKRFRGFFQLGV
jgi:CRP-like cAMP-binding protein